MTKLLIFIFALTPTAALAGSSYTTLACSSESGRTIISGILPGQGMEEVRLNVSIGTYMMTYASDEGYSRNTTATVELDARRQEVKIKVKSGDFQIEIRSEGRAKLSHNSNGTKGSFVGLLTGTHPGNWEKIQSPIRVRCFVTDEI